MIAPRFCLPILGLGLAACNLAWTPDRKDYLPPPVNRIDVDDFGVDAPVDILATGQLPVTVTRKLTNTGSFPVRAGYSVTETVRRLRFQAINPVSYQWVEVADPAFTYFTCTAPGPALAPGATADVTFTFPGPNCVGPPGQPTPAVLDCGLYKETLVVDAGTDVSETDEGDNETEHFFFIPSSQGRLNMMRTPDPGGDPNIDVVGPPPRTAVINIFKYPPGPTMVVAHNVRITSAPPTAGWIVNGISPRNGARSGAVGRLVPMVQFVDPAPAPPRTVDYRVTFNRVVYVPPHPIASEILDSKVTAITTDGCQIRQRSLRTTVRFEIPG
jgi:hypothetical protein